MRPRGVAARASGQDAVAAAKANATDGAPDGDGSGRFGPGSLPLEELRASQSPSMAGRGGQDTKILSPEALLVPPRDVAVSAGCPAYGLSADVPRPGMLATYRRWSEEGLDMPGQSPLGCPRV